MHSWISCAYDMYTVLFSHRQQLIAGATKIPTVNLSLPNTTKSHFYYNNNT